MSKQPQQTPGFDREQAVEVWRRTLINTAKEAVVRGRSAGQPFPSRVTCTITFAAGETLEIVVEPTSDGRIDVVPL